MFEKPPRIALAFDEGAPGVLALRHVLDRHQNAVPCLFMSGKDGAMEFDVQPLSGQRIVHGRRTELALAIPELAKLADVRGEHVVAEDAGDVGDERGHVGRLEQRQRLAVHLHDADQRRTFGDASTVRAEPCFQIVDPVPTQRLESEFQRAVIFEPERHRREVEHDGIVAAAPAGGGSSGLERWFGHRNIRQSTAPLNGEPSSYRRLSS